MLITKKKDKYFQNINTLQSNVFEVLLHCVSFIRQGVKQSTTHNIFIY